MLNAAGEQDEPEAIGLTEARFLDLAVKDDQLLAEESILGDKLRFVSEQVESYGECKRMTSRLSEIEEILPNDKKEMVAALAERFEDSTHLLRSLESCQKLSRDSSREIGSGQVAGVWGFWLSQGAKVKRERGRLGK